VGNAASSVVIEGRKLAGGRFEPAAVPVVVEKELRISVNGRPLVTASIMPGLEREFVTGYLFGQGFIEGLADIASLDIKGNDAAVRLTDTAGPPTSGTSYRVVSGGGRAAFSTGVRLRPNDSPLKVRQEDIFRAMNALFEKAAVYRETEGTHAAGLFTAGAETVCTVEDIGRHNTLDKVIGRALLSGVDGAGTFLVCTGRLSSEMVAKVCRAGIPIAATKTAVTDRGLDTGREHGLTIISFVRDAGTRVHTDMEVRTITEPVMKVYTGAARVISG
jgi:FdhD protein